VEQIHDRVAGLDVHRDVVVACARVPGARGGTVTEKERFQTTTGALARLAGDPDEEATPAERNRNIGSMIRGVRLVFLAVAAFAAGAGWRLGHPLPLVVALVIAGIDVLETSFLLLVVNLRSRE